MILSADDLDILNFLKSTPGQFVSMRSISLRAGGRRKYEESPGWAKGLMAPLVEGGLVEMNDRGHYRSVEAATELVPAKGKANTPPPPPKKKIIGDDYFPASAVSGVVGDNYFPPA